MPADKAFLDALLVRPIGRDVDTSRFVCNETIDWYIRNAACDHHERRFTTVHCFLHNDDLAGYVTTSMTEIVIDDSPLRGFYGLTEILLRKGGGHRKRFPGLLIGMLGTCVRYRRRGLGEQMVKYAVGQASSASDVVACRFVAVDSDDTPEAKGLYEKVGFRPPEGQKRADTIRMLYDLGRR